MRLWITGLRYEQSEQLLHLDRCWWSLQWHRENKHCCYWGLSHVTWLRCCLPRGWTLCFSSFSVYIFFFSRLVFSEEDFTGEEEMPSFRGELCPPARSPPPTKHTHKHAADGVSVTFQNVKWFSMLVGWCFKWLWGAFTYLRNCVIIPDDYIQQWETFWEKYTLILPILQSLISSNHH